MVKNKKVGEGVEKVPPEKYTLFAEKKPPQVFWLENIRNRSSINNQDRLRFYYVSGKYFGKKSILAAFRGLAEKWPGEKASVGGKKTFRRSKNRVSGKY